MKPRTLLTIAHSYAVALNRRLAHELARAGGEQWEVTAVAPSYFHGGRDLRPVSFEAIPDEPVRVEVVPARMTQFVHFFTYGPELGDIISRGWDLVHAWEEPFIFAGRQITRLVPQNTTLVWATFQNLPKRYPPPFNWIERESMRRAAGWIAFGHTVSQTLSHREGYRDHPMRVIPPGVDLDRFQPNREAGAELRRELGWAESGAPVIGFLGRFTSEKGLSLAMRTLESLRTPWRALFVGAGTMEGELRAWAKRFDQRVRICTEVSHDQVPRYLNAMDVLIAPSQTRRRWREQFGRMLIEAFACGVPVLGSDSGEIPHVIGDAGVVLPESDSRAWIDALENLLESPGRQREFSERGLQRVRENFSWPKIARQYLEFFNEIVEGKGSGFGVRGSENASTGTTASAPSSLNPEPRTLNPAVEPRTLNPPPRKLLSIAHSYVVALNRRLVQEMIRQGGGRWEVTAVAPSYFHGAQDLRPMQFEPLDGEPPRVEVIPAHLSRFVHIFSYGRKLKEILGEGWDFVHAWEEPFIWAGGQISRWTPAHVPLVYRTAQSLNKWYPPPFNWIERHGMDRAAGWICSGTLVAQTLGARALYARKPMRLIPLGVDADLFSPNRAAGDAIRRKLGWNESDAPVVGFLGRFTHAKGLQLLMNVLDDLGTPWRALFVGAGPMESALRTWGSRFGDRVRICTDVGHNEVPAYLNAMDVLAAPSQTTPAWREQFGRMLIEAFACGVPVIGSDSGEIPFVIRSTGVIVSERDQTAWTHALRSLLNSPEKRHEIADAARSRVRDEFAWPAIARKHLQFFDELLQSATPSAR